LSYLTDTVFDMSERWNTGQVLALAPDSSSRQAASGLASQSSWTGWGTAAGLVWGLCAGSGKNPYQTVVDLTGPAYRCSCPSRKFPCKHALGLLLAWAGDAVPDAGEPSDYARAWQDSRVSSVRARDQRAEKKKASGDAGVKDTAGAARRSQQRAQRVAAGVADLQTWLRDQVRAGLSSTPGAGYQYTEPIAARMVDAQAPGLAATLRALAPVPATGEGWPARLLAEYAQLHLLTRACERVSELPPGLAAVVRSRVGYSTSREDVLVSPAVSDLWQVIAVRDLPDAPVPARRTWLRGRRSGKPALLLAFAGGPSGSFRGSPDADLAAGTELSADVHYYPGPPLRAVAGERRGPVTACRQPEGATGIGALLEDWAAALEQDPWLTEWPALLSGVPVTTPEPAGRVPARGGPPGWPAPGAPRWSLADPSGAAVPLLGRDSLWTLLAVSGGAPVTVAGEWSPDGFTPLTVWHEGQAVPL
jgi:hypothetical protein